jgi:hypothetical protein
MRDDGTRRGVMVTPRGRASVVDAALKGLPTAVSEMWTHGGVARRVAKVCRAATDERHLFVGIGNGGLPDPVHSTIMGEMPEAAEGCAHHAGRADAPMATTGWSGSLLIVWSRIGQWSAWPLDDDRTAPDLG